MSGMTETSDQDLLDVLAFKEANQELYDMLLYSTEWFILNCQRLGMNPPNLSYLQGRIREISARIDAIYPRASDEKKQEDYADWLRRRGNRTLNIALNSRL